MEQKYKLYQSNTQILDQTVLLLYIYRVFKMYFYTIFF